MRFGGIAVACAVLVAGILASTYRPNASASAPRNSTTVAPAIPAALARGRVFLSNAQLDQALASGMLDRPVKSLLAVPSRMQFGDYVWNDAAVPAGPTWIRVDLGSQIISIFRAGHEIGTAVIVYGGDNKQTPTGILHVLGKAREHRSSLYDAEMPYTLRLTEDGVSIHGSAVRWGAATHGCIGVPLAFAQRLFDATKVGDPVVVVPPRAERKT
jgi:lipoprotein-anchoring transpeptidase ErfK/SrfK